MRFQDMNPYVPYRVVKGNTNGGIVEGDIISCSFGRETLKIWAGKDIRVYGRDSLAIFSIIDFECEPADDYELVVSKWKTKCRKRA